MTPLEIAHDYISRGWAPIPIRSGEKGPKGKGWQDIDINADNAAQFFGAGALNIGVRLGPKSGGLCDVDLDCREAVQVAPAFLPDTDAVFGRKSKRRSHYLYRVADPEPTAAIRLEYEGVIVELRLGGGGKGAQTVFPGSVHPSGERIEWECNGSPADVSCARLRAAVTKIALAVVLIRQWNKVARHEAALRLGGFLSRAGWEQDDVAHFIETVARAAGDEEVGDRVNAARDAGRAFASGENTYGLPALREHFGSALADKIAAWLGHREVDTNSTLEQMNDRYCIVPYGGKVRVLSFELENERELATYYSAADFRLLHVNKRIPVAGRKDPVQLGDWWLKHPERRQHEGVIFAPGKPALVDGRLNLWRGWGIEPRAGDWSLLRKHIELVLAGGNTAYADYILRWTAWTFQNPGELPEVALVFRGGKGTGKGLFGRALRDAFGQHGLHISSARHLTGNFNRHLQDCALLFADEAFWPGDKAGEGTLKRLLTEPTIFIEAKGVDGRDYKNCLHIIIAANADWVVPASADERRFAMFQVSDCKAQDRSYFAPLYQQITNGGVAAMMHELLSFKLEGWHPRYDVPKTAALLDQQKRSLSAEDEWWAGLLAEGILPASNAANPRRAQSVALFDHARRAVPRLAYASDNHLGHELAQRGCRRVKVGGARGWEFPLLAEARKHWSARIPTVWDDESAEWSWG